MRFVWPDTYAAGPGSENWMLSLRACPKGYLGGGIESDRKA
jgi:hypothetical protein